MRFSRRGRVAMAASLIAVAAVVMILAGALSFYVFYSMQNGSRTTSTTGLSSTAATSTTSGTASSSRTTTLILTTSTVSTTSGTTSTTSTTGLSSTTGVSTTGESTTTTTSGFILPKGSSEVVIPAGIDGPNAKAENITFNPYNLVVQIGVNNTIYFVDSDPARTGHVIESTSWPTGGQVFAFPILPGQVYNFTLTVPGNYTYNCEWHPVWMTGTIKVLPAKA